MEKEWVDCHLSKLLAWWLLSQCSPVKNKQKDVAKLVVGGGVAA